MMKDFKVRDFVKAGVKEFSPVFIFTHHACKQIRKFIDVIIKSGKYILLTRSHIIYANGDMKIASDVVVGANCEQGSIYILYIALFTISR